MVIKFVRLNNRSIIEYIADYFKRKRILPQFNTKIHSISIERLKTQNKSEFYERHFDAGKTKTSDVNKTRLENSKRVFY